MNKEDVACILTAMLVMSVLTMIVFDSFANYEENHYEINVSTENKVLFKIGSIGTLGNMVWQGNWWELSHNQSCFKPTDYGIKFKEYVYADGIYEIVYSDSFFFNHASLLDNNGIAYIVLENATITIAIV